MPIRKKLEHIFCSVIAVYIALIISSFIISVNMVNELFGVQLDMKLAEIGCEKSYEQRSSNPLNAFEFYSNFGYWTSDFRMGIKEFNNPKCKNAVMERFNEYPRSIDIVVLDNNSRIVVSLSKTVNK